LAIERKKQAHVYKEKECSKFIGSKDLVHTIQDRGEFPLFENRPVERLSVNTTSHWILFCFIQDLARLAEEIFNEVYRDKVEAFESWRLA
ncbi:MAG: hypothetical protein JW839_07595, partial [Candidatus Lokiarchaeota archaeon]|nr:hypothetical protein [Candidatus Lokiarchaeota archaeon]